MDEELGHEGYPILIGFVQRSVWALWPTRAREVKRSFVALRISLPGW